MDRTKDRTNFRVGLIGFGRTGREVARHLLNAEGVELTWVVRQSDKLRHQAARDVLGLAEGPDAPIIPAAEVPAMDLISQRPVDAIIDFSAEVGLAYYASAAAWHDVAVVSAVSHYAPEQQHRLRWLSQRVPVLWSPNITLGINVVLLAAQTLQRIVPDIDVQIIEEHFRAKAQVSGTALRLAETLHTSADHIHSLRAGGIVGTHEVVFGLPTQTIRFRHEAISREAFGDGALFAARQISMRTAGLYSMDDLLRPMFAEASDPDHIPDMQPVERIPA